MAQSLSDEEFSRMQTQLIELRTLNYELEANCQRQQGELSQLQEKYSNQEKELLRTNKIINKSKNRKEYAVLLEENEILQGQLQTQEENFKLQNQTLMEEISKLNDDNEKLQRQVTVKDGSQDLGSESEIRRLRAENTALQKSLANCQERFDQELLQLKGRLQSLSDEQFESHTESQDSETVGENSVQDGTLLEKTGGHTTSKFEELETSDKLQEILNRELLVFSEKVFCSKTGDVSKEREMNQRHQVAQCSSDGKDGEDNAKPEDFPTDRQSRQETFEIGTAEELVDQRFHTEVDNLRRNLTEGLVPLILSTDDLLNRARMVRSPTRERLEKVETKSMALEKQVKEMSGLQLQLDTEREEKRILQEQLLEAESSRKQEASKLEQELAKLSDKVKRKQESYLQLQEEKERLYSENKKRVDDLNAVKEQERQILTEQIAKVQDELNASNQLYKEYKEDAERKMKALEQTVASQQTEASSTAEEAGQILAGVRQENESLISELQGLKQKIKTVTEEQEESEDLITQLENKVSLSETRCAELALEVDELHAHLKEQNAAVEGWNEQIAQLAAEKDQLATSLQEISKVAESRKNLLDEMAIEKQKDDTTHREQLEKIEEGHKKELSEVKDQLTGEKKLRKDLEESQQTLMDAKNKIQSLESKSGWFERRLTETEENLKTVKEQNEINMAELQKEKESELETIQEERIKETEDFQSQMSALESEIEEKEQELGKLCQELKDKEVENRIAGKKGDQLVKDLKRQLKLERKRAEQLQQRLQEALSENRVKPTFEDLFSPKEIQRRNSGDSSVLSHPSRGDVDSPDFRPPSPAASIVSMLNDDTTDLIERLADVQQEKWLLEEKVRHLEENGAALADDLIQKSAIIQAYAMETKIGPVAESPKAPSTPISSLKEKIRSPFGKAKSQTTRKMQLMLEETLTKNVQLQQDIDVMSKELAKLQHQESAPQETDDTSETSESLVTSLPQQTNERLADSS